MKIGRQDKTTKSKEVMQVEIRVEGETLTKRYYEFAKANARLLLRIAEAIACKDQIERDGERPAGEAAPKHKFGVDYDADFKLLHPNGWHGGDC
jgi:hypothetical protein